MGEYVPEILSQLYLELANVLPESVETVRDEYHRRIISLAKFHLLPATMHDNDDPVANYADVVSRIKQAIRVLDGDLHEDY